MANTGPLQLNLGSLRSAMSLTLHTHHASRIWHGRAAAEGKPAIVGLNGFIAAMNKMKRGAEQDDPYSDWWMLRIEEKLEQTRTTLQAVREQVDQALSAVPPALSLGENLNVQPVKLPLFVNAQLGFAAVYLLADFDDLARKLILAHHTALIDRSTPGYTAPPSSATPSWCSSSPPRKATTTPTLAACLTTAWRLWPMH